MDPSAATVILLTSACSWHVQEKVDHIGIVALVTGTPITALLVSLFP